MSNGKQNDEIGKVLFANLVMMLSSSAMQQLGKLVNPLTNKTEINLEAAQLTIDMLEMLKDKTRGNLDKDEENMLGGILSSLQMNFVETSETAARNATKDGKKQEARADEKPAEQKTDEKPPEPSSSKEPKYRKSYGP